MNSQFSTISSTGVLSFLNDFASVIKQKDNKIVERDWLLVASYQHSELGLCFRHACYWSNKRVSSVLSTDIRFWIRSYSPIGTKLVLLLLRRSKGSIAAF